MSDVTGYAVVVDSSAVDEMAKTDNCNYTKDQINQRWHSSKHFVSFYVLLQYFEKKSTLDGTIVKTYGIICHRFSHHVL